MCVADEAEAGLSGVPGTRNYFTASFETADPIHCQGFDYAQQPPNAGPIVFIPELCGLLHQVRAPSCLNTREYEENFIVVGLILWR